MEIKEIIGIDVSKLTLDICIHSIGVQEVFENSPEGIANLCSWVSENIQVDKEAVVFVFEYTGLYAHELTHYLSDNDFLLYLVPGLEIKRSLGITRGKNDKVDAKRIALYGYRIKDEIVPCRLPGVSLETLKRLMSMRKKLVAQRAGHITTLKEQKKVLSKEEGAFLFSIQENVIKMLSKQITAIEKEIDSIISEDKTLNEMHKLLRSVKGIGHVTARFLIVFTAGFTRFGTWRKFACYCGIAPFPNQSGTSFKGRAKVCHLANKEGKTLFHMCAMTAIQHDPEMKAYYERRLKSGKNEMSTLNIIRNKILARAFAVIGRGTPYVNTMKYAA